MRLLPAILLSKLAILLTVGSSTAFAVSARPILLSLSRTSPYADSENSRSLRVTDDGAVACVYWEPRTRSYRTYANLAPISKAMVEQIQKLGTVLATQALTKTAKQYTLETFPDDCYDSAYLNYTVQGRVEPFVDINLSGEHCPSQGRVKSSESAYLEGIADLLYDACLNRPTGAKNRGR